MDNVFQKLYEAGQSYWLDNLNRTLIENGGLEKEIAGGLRGITTNPAIFYGSLQDGNAYETLFQKSIAGHNPVSMIYEELTVADVRDACDLLLGIYTTSDHEDGYVSLEVSPYLAYDAAGTVIEANRLAEAVNRPNLMIKVPGTRIGLKAVEELVYQGINVNITLIFSTDRYEEAFWSIVRGLEKRLHEKRPIENIAAVTSFFLSRIDVLVDQLLEHRMHTQSAAYPFNARDLLGKTAIAEAKKAYQKFKLLTGHRRWRLLEDRGARRPRLLWASTGQKNESYSDVMYIEPLIGPNTISTMPEVTARAFADHGKVVPDSVREEAVLWMNVFDKLESLDIHLNCVSEQLKNEGIQKFIKPYEASLALIEMRMRDFQS